MVIKDAALHLVQEDLPAGQVDQDLAGEQEAELQSVGGGSPEAPRVMVISDQVVLIFSPRRRLGGATTGTPCCCSSLITPDQPAASANAPWTRTTVGMLLCVMRMLLKDRCSW
ncbi:hypothetical protein [Nonomuraea sp. NPDC049784]|uniref:hypothetical protein n=1 Tax=Nonomuraea sp. NPDC049784 TaxID=3154361 RepID=UPI0033F620E4